ncbi:uncharacterized protein MELLADRAFT_87283 [Melampsora larici-populina 98AG31]|uniref:Uncharacterized protein n=1 Tax=Melampsora larici-populina (strain 98AG31 / pathotype 3-4-7) TaxID=747676 RepID=F4RMP1_MELLP|nr:uncharacterized protein MELLADRAFT_87283 [Melampsora larici-populina 98AG31]EGG06346.1 hypothetical protein MELLADRAFT_87283 [Melampsora larici-populina 98AG31]
MWNLRRHFSSVYQAVQPLSCRLVPPVAHTTMRQQEINFALTLDPIFVLKSRQNSTMI